MTDRELLEALFAFLSGRTYIQGDKDSIADMVKRYAHPPLSRAFPVAMKLSTADYRKLMALLDKMDKHLNIHTIGVTDTTSALEKYVTLFKDAK